MKWMSYGSACLCKMDATDGGLEAETTAARVYDAMV